MSLRFAKPSDTTALLNIYAQYIETPITFEEVLPSEEEFQNRIMTISKKYPYLIWEEDGKICGYAYAHEFRERAAYQWGVELSIYIDGQHHRGGIGKKLYTALLEMLTLQGVEMCYSGVTLPNEKSEGLHLAMGFNFLGSYKHAGYKSGAWHDVGWFQKQIGKLEKSPGKISSIHDLPNETLETIMNRV